MTPTYTGKQVFMETLAAEGVKYVFGNPGTTELPLIESLQDYPQISYIMALHEAIAVSMADAYAHVSGEVAVANLHVGPGLGNGLGSLYNAWEGQTPLIVTAGQQDNRMRLRDPLLGHDLVAMAEPLVKWSVQVESADEMALIMHRAFKTARETPSGPVFVSLPINVMEQQTHLAPIAPSVLYSRTPPDPDGISQAAAMLRGANNPTIIYGDKVARSGGLDALVALAELAGATVFAEVLPSHVSFPSQHPQFRGRIAQDHGQIRGVLGETDVVLLAGGEFFEEIWFDDAHPFPDTASIIQIDPSPANLGKNLRVDCGVLSDPALALEALKNELAAQVDDGYHQGASARKQALSERKEAEWEAQMAKATAQPGNQPMAVAALMAALKDSLPKGVSIAGEPISAGIDMLRTLSFEQSGDYLAARGGGIGQGLPSTIGMKLAMPERPVLCLSGDGSSLYTIQTLWSVAHHNIPVVFLIINNRAYRILKLNMNRYRRGAKLADRGYQHLDISEPLVDFVSIAKGFGLQAVKVEAAEDVGPAIERAFASGEPWLIDAVVDGAL